MPELPEVETTRRGLEAPLRGRIIARVLVREPRLRWRVPRRLAQELPGLTIRHVERRAKYLLLRTDAGTVILHLGMSGSLRVIKAGTPPEKHDHVDLVLDDGRCLRLRDPRRFGALLWTRDDPMQHPLLRHLGPEPLGPDFHAGHLYAATRRRRVAVRDLLLNSRIVALLRKPCAGYSAGGKPLTKGRHLESSPFLCLKTRSAISRPTGDRDREKSRGSSTGFSRRSPGSSASWRRA